MSEWINVKDIKIFKNIRTEVGDVSDLMNSIKENSLLHPLGVVKKGREFLLIYGHRRFSALKKLGRKKLEIGKEVLLKDVDSDIDLLVMNAVENFHTKQNTPLEFAKVCLILHEMGLSISEISARFSVPKSRIASSISLIGDVPDSIKKYIGAGYGRTDKKGFISPTVSSAIAFCKKRYRLEEGEIEKFYLAAKKMDFSTRDVRVISLLMDGGMAFEKALKEKKEWINKQVDIIVRKEELLKIEKKWLFKNYIYNLLKINNKNLSFNRENKSTEVKKK